MAGDTDRNAGDDSYFVGVWTERSAIIENDVATSQKIDTVTAKANDNAATIRTVERTQASKTEAVASRVDTLQAEIKDPATGLVATTALVRQESLARADQYGSIAQTLNTVQSTAVDADNRSKTNTATVQSHTQSINGLYGQYTLKIDVGGRISGFGLASTPYASAFNIRADQFYISNPNDPNYKDLGFVYQSGTSTDPETGQVTPQGLYLKAAFIKEASITTAKIRGQAVSVVDAAENRSSMTSPTVRVNAAGNKILVRVVFYQPALYGAHTFSIYKNGYLMQAYPASVSSGGGGLTFPSIVIETPTAGGHGETTFYATATGAVSSVAAITISATSLKR